MSDVKNSSLATSLVSYWELEEASGTRVDSHGSNDLTDINTVQSIAAIQGDGADFESSNLEKLTRASNTDLYTSGNWSVSLWYKPETASAGQVLISYSDSTDLRVALHFFIFTSKMYVRRQRAAGSEQFANCIGATTLTNGTWYHMVATFSTTSGMKVYLNGSLDGTEGTTTVPVNTTAREIALGYRNRGTGDFYTDGVVDEVGFWHRELSSTDVTTLYNSGAGIPYEAAAGGYRFNPQIRPFAGL